MLKFLRTRPLALVLLAVTVLLIFLHLVGILKPVEGLVFRIFSPLQHRIYAWGSGFNNIYSSLTSRGNLVEENSRLQTQVATLAAANAQLKVKLEESGQLEVQRNFLESLGIKAIAARVIGKNPEANWQSIILDKGEKDGIKVGMPLIVGEGIMVGKIFSVNANNSQAILINDARSRVAAIIQTATNSQGVVVGEHGLSLKMELIPQNEVIREGDLVITSGLEPSITRGLVIGKISRIESESNNLFQTAYIQSLVKIDNLTVVSILINQFNESR